MNRTKIHKLTSKDFKPIDNSNMNLLKLFKTIAYAEGISYLLFGLTMPLKYYFLMPEPNFYVGMIHGFLFMVYALFTLILFIKFRWTFLKAVLVFAASLIPFGTFLADKRLFNDRKKYIF